MFYSWFLSVTPNLISLFFLGIEGPDGILRFHPKYAAAIMVPVALAFIFNIRQWWKNEDGLKKKLISVPFLILQLYPPFAAYRLLVYLITRDKKWFEAKKVYDTSMASIGKSSEFIEYTAVLYFSFKSK